MILLLEGARVYILIRNGHGH